MKIAHVSDCYLPRLGGIELHVHDLAHLQHAVGHSVTVVTSVAGADEPGAVVVRRPNGSDICDADGAIRYSRSFGARTAVLAGEYDVVHVHVSTFSPLAFLTAEATSRLGVPTVVTVHSLWSRATPLFRVADLLCRWGDWPVAWSAVSPAAAKPLRRILRDRAPVAVLPNGIEPTLWWGPHANTDPFEVRLISVMRLVRRKRPRELLSIIREVAKRLTPSVRLTVEIIGDGPQRLTLERYLRHHDMTDWVDLVGRGSRTQIRNALHRADIFVTAATLESFGIAALEARSAGLPVVARANTGIEDFITHRREGFIASSDAEMVEGIVELIESPVLRASIRAHNLAVPPTVTWNDIITQCDNLYRAATALRSSNIIPAPRDLTDALSP